VRPLHDIPRFLLVLFVAACTVGEPRGLPPEGFPPFDAGMGEVDGGDADGGVGSCASGATIGMECANDAQCNDGCFCNGVETCDEGLCVAGALDCADALDCTMDVCDEENDRCLHEPNHEVCQDEDACNGAEVCDPTGGDVEAGGCRGAAPLYCNDEDSCTVDACDTETGCTYTPRDLDGDGFTDGRCGGMDCNDDPRDGMEIFPGAEEDCLNRRDDNCDGMRDFLDPGCIPTNGTCDTARLIDGPGTYSGATRSLAADTELRCRTSGPDAFFRFTLSETMDVRATASGGSGTAIAIRRWSQCEDGPELACNEFTPATVLARSLPAGDYAIVVKQASAGIFDLNVRFEDPTEIPPVDLCSAGTVDVSEGGTFTGMFAEVEDDYRLSCHSGSWRDAVYTFTIDEPKDVTLDLSTSGSGFTTSYLALVTSCDDPETTLSCSAARPAQVRRRDLPAGTYWVLIESSNMSATTWQLDVLIEDPAPRQPGDVCSSAIDITDAGGSAMLDGAELDSGTSCGGTSTAFRDVYFSFELDELRDVELSTIVPSGSTYVSLSPAACGVIGAEQRCRSGTVLTQNFRSLPAGLYYVTVSTSGRTGNVLASITTSEPTPIPPNDRCDGAIDVSPPGYSSRDTLIDFEDDVSGTSCFSCPDAIYQLTLDAPGEPLISVRRADGMGTSAIRTTLRDGCASGTQLATDNGNPSVINTPLEAGTYYLIVESSTSTVSDYEIRVTYF